MFGDSYVKQMFANSYIKLHFIFQPSCNKIQILQIEFSCCRRRQNGKTVVIHI